MCAENALANTLVSDIVRLGSHIHVATMKPTQVHRVEHGLDINICPRVPLEWRGGVVLLLGGSRPVQTDNRGLRLHTLVT